MVNELRELMREATDRPPHDAGDLRAVLGAGRRRVRVRRVMTVGGTALAAGAVALTSVAWSGASREHLPATDDPHVAGPVVRLDDARAAVEGRDYRELTSVTSPDLAGGDGQYVDGVTDDGLALFRDGPRSDRLWPRYALLDPATGQRYWLPGTRSFGQQQLWAVELGAQQIVRLGPDRSSDDGSTMSLVAHVLDRDTGTWRTLRWAGLPGTTGPWGSHVGPDGRLYVRVPATTGAVPEGGWPQGPGGEADDSDAEGDSSDLWSVSLTDPSDVRDEGVRVGEFDFAGDALVWSDSSNGAAGLVHVRDLASGDETSFDPRLGSRCNLLGLDAADDRIVMSQYCGTTADGRDDRVQVVTTDGDQVVTVQDSGVDGGTMVDGAGAFTFTTYGADGGGTYLYDLEEGRLLRVGEGMPSWTTATGPAPDGTFLWTTPAGGTDPTYGRAGATAHVGEVLR